MRYKINKKLRKILQQNSKILEHSKLKNSIKNLLYKNKSISQKQLKSLSQYCKISNLKIKPIKFRNELNFGRYIEYAPVRFRGIDSNFSEFIGIMLGDGNIYRNNIRITINFEEKQFKNHIKNLFYQLFRLHFKEYKYKKSKTLSLYKCNKELKELLIHYGLKEGNKKKNNVGIPFWVMENKNYGRRCLRGLIDTDGCVYWHKRDKKYYISFSNRSKALLDDTLLLSTKLGIPFVQNNKYEVSLYKKDDVNKYIKEIGFANNKHSTKLGL